MTLDEVRTLPSHGCRQMRSSPLTARWRATLGGSSRSHRSTRSGEVGRPEAWESIAAPAEARPADGGGRCRFQGVPNQPESASRSASAAVSVGSSMAAAQAMWASGRIRRVSAGR